MSYVNLYVITWLTLGENEVYTLNLLFYNLVILVTLEHLLQVGLNYLSFYLNIVSLNLNNMFSEFQKNLNWQPYVI